MLALVATVALLFQQTPAPQAPDSANTVEEAVVDVTEAVTRARVRPVLSPSAFYSVTRGIGIGGGVAVNDLARPGDHVQVEARLSQRLQGGFGVYTTADPGERRWSGLIGGAGWTTSRTYFEGHGPHAVPSADLWLDRLAAQTETRLVWAPAGPRGVIVQPTLRTQFDRIRRYEEASEGALTRIAPDDLSRLTALVDDDRYGVELAVSAFQDTRNIPTMPSRGAYLEGEVGRFQSLDGSGLGVWRAQGAAFWFRPALVRLPFLPERGALFLKANGVLTRQTGAASLPWIYLPSLDRDLVVGYPRSDFVGRDAFSVGAGVRGVIGEALGALLVEGVAEVNLGAAYDDVFREFSPTLRFGTVTTTAGERVPLSPSAGIGLNLHYIDRERPIVGALLGVGPGGVTVTSLRLIYGLGVYRPVLR